MRSAFVRKMPRHGSLLSLRALTDLQEYAKDLVAKPPEDGLRGIAMDIDAKEARLIERLRSS